MSRYTGQARLDMLATIAASHYTTGPDPAPFTGQHPTADEVLHIARDYFRIQATEGEAQTALDAARTGKDAR